VVEPILAPSPELALFGRFYCCRFLVDGVMMSQRTLLASDWSRTAVQTPPSIFCPGIRRTPPGWRWVLFLFLSTVSRLPPARTRRFPLFGRTFIQGTVHFVHRPPSVGLRHPSALFRCTVDPFRFHTFLIDKPPFPMTKKPTAAVISLSGECPPFPPSYTPSVPINERIFPDRPF